MKKLLIAMLAGLLGFAACRKDSEITETTVINPTPAYYVKASIGGRVIAENGSPVPAAKVSLGANTATTDKNGVFYFKDKIVNGNGAYVKVEHPNYFHGSRTIKVNAATRNQVLIQLLSNESTEFVSASAGGTADYTDYSITLPGGGVVTAAGAPFSGQVGVAAKWLDPTDDDFVLQMPGRLQGVQTDGTLSGMVSMGMLAVELKDDAGNKLQIAPGHEAAIRMKVPSGILGKAPASIPLWYFDEAKGIWVEEGEAKLVGNFYEGKVKHFSFWNHDYKDPLVEIDFKVVDTDGNPVPGAKVWTQLVNSGLYGFGYTDNTGHILGLVPQNQLLDAKVFAPMQNCNTPVLETQIGPFTQNGMHCFTIDYGPVYEYTISGNLVDCNNNPVTDGYVRLDANGDVGFVDAQGNFEITLVSCTPLTNVSLVGYDMTALKESGQVTLALVPGSNSAGTIQVCTALQTYFTYSFPGKNVVYATASAFSIDSVAGGPLDFVIVSHSDSSGYYINFNFENLTGPGVYPISYFSVEGSDNGQFAYHYCQSCPGFNVTITEYNGINDYIAGTFTGTVTDATNQANPVPILISGSFRTKLK